MTGPESYCGLCLPLHSTSRLLAFLSPSTLMQQAVAGLGSEYNHAFCSNTLLQSVVKNVSIYNGTLPSGSGGNFLSLDTERFTSIYHSYKASTSDQVPAGVLPAFQLTKPCQPPTGVIPLARTKAGPRNI